MAENETQRLRCRMLHTGKQGFCKKVSFLGGAEGPRTNSKRFAPLSIQGTKPETTEI